MTKKKMMMMNTKKNKNMLKKKYTLFVNGMVMNKLYMHWFAKQL